LNAGRSKHAANDVGGESSRNRGARFAAIRLGPRLAQTALALIRPRARLDRAASETLTIGARSLQRMEAILNVPGVSEHCCVADNGCSRSLQIEQLDRSKPPCNRHLRSA
jgi:hypothetical protein